MTKTGLATSKAAAQAWSSVGREARRGNLASARRISGQSLFLVASTILSALVLLGVLVLGPDRSGDAAARPLRLKDIPFDGARAYEYLKQIAALGPRPSGSPGMAAQQRLLVNHFEKLGGKVEFQRFQMRHPVDGSAVPGANLLVHWNPEAKQRILLCAHYDTLPLPMRDPVDPRGVFVGANDGASGVAVLMELGREMPARKSAVGVDFALFDAEEFIFDEQHTYFVGSEHFARQYVQAPPAYRYRCAVLLDMVGDADLQIYKDGTSFAWSDSQPLVQQIWATAARLGVREFIPRVKYDMKDDHLPLHDIGKIPACDVIDYDYPPWHTRGDTADKCSALSLAKVGWVIGEWLKTADETK